MNDFPQYIQLYPSEFNFAPQIVGGIVYFGWKQITIITQTESLFLTVTHLIITEPIDKRKHCMGPAIVERLSIALQRFKMF